jgi:hypothetical protein
MHTSEYDYLFKLLLIGDSGVGKVGNRTLLLFVAQLWFFPSLACSFVSPTTHTQKATSAQLESTSRFAPSNWKERL